jgi:hypothetical protein
MRLFKSTCFSLIYTSLLAFIKWVYIYTRMGVIEQIKRSVKKGIYKCKYIKEGDEKV